MSLSQRKITDAQINSNGVVSAPDNLTGTAAENKAVFDKLIKNIVKAAVNNVIDDLLATTAASEIGGSVNGMSGTNVAALLTELKNAVDDRVAISATQYTEAQKTQIRDNIGVAGSQVAVTSVNGHTGAVVGLQEVNDSTLATSVKTVPGGINELYYRLDKKVSVTLPTASWVQSKSVNATTTITSGTVSVNKATFLSQLSSTGTYVFTYDGTNWNYNSASVDLATYGITFTGEPASTNTITVVVALIEEYTQTISVTGSNANSKIDLQPDHLAIEQMLADQCCAIFIANNANTLTAYAVGKKPSVDLTMQATIYEVTI